MSGVLQGKKLDLDEVLGVRSPVTLHHPRRVKPSLNFPGWLGRLGASFARSVVLLRISLINLLYFPQAVNGLCWKFRGGLEIIQNKAARLKQLTELRKLSEVTCGKWLCAAMNDSKLDLERLRQLGLFPGQAFVVLAVGDPMVLRIGPSRIGMSRRLADQIIVRTASGLS